MLLSGKGTGANQLFRNINSNASANFERADSKGRAGLPLLIEWSQLRRLTLATKLRPLPRRGHHVRCRHWPTSIPTLSMSALRGEADIPAPPLASANDPKRTSSGLTLLGEGRLHLVGKSLWSIVKTRGSPAAATARSSRTLPSANVQTQLRLASGRCIVALAANGVTDPTDLERQAVERIVLGEEVASSASSLIAQ